MAGFRTRFRKNRFEKGQIHNLVIMMNTQNISDYINLYRALFGLW